MPVLNWWSDLIWGGSRNSNNVHEKHGCAAGAGHDRTERKERVSGANLGGSETCIGGIRLYDCFEFEIA